MKPFFLILLSLGIGIELRAQENLTDLSLEQAIQTGLSKNIDVRQGRVSLESNQVAYNQARLNLLPSVNANVNHGINQGRSIDPFTNTYVDQEIKFGTYGVGASLLLFNGLGLQNTIRQTERAYSAAELELQQAKDNLRLSIILAYLQVLNNEDLVEVAQNQVLVTQEQLERLQLLHTKGAISPPLIAELNGQLKSEEVALLNARQALEGAKLALAQLMNVPYHKHMRLQRIEVESLMLESAEATEAEEVYSEAVGQLALIKAAQLRRQSAEAGVRAMRSTYYPSLFLVGNLNSNYSSVATINGEPIYYEDQIRNNVFSTISLSLRIPIFNAFSAHNQVRNTKLQLQEASLAEESVHQQLRQEIEQAQLNLNGARERYQILQEQQQAFAEAFRAAEIRFNAGAGTPVDYLIAKNNLDRSRISLVSAKYDWVLRHKILEFYLGR